MVFHVLSWLGNQLNSVSKKQIRKGFGNVAFITEKLTEEVFSHGSHHLEVPVIHVSFGEIKRQNFSFIVDYQVQFEPEKPSQGALTPLGDSFEGLVLVDSSVVAGSERCGIYEADSCSSSQAFEF